MKKCPFCGADLADEAQFCLYCMQPLTEKEIIPPIKRRPKGWLFVLGGILILVMIFLLWPRTEDDSTDPVIQATTTATTLPTTGATAPSGSVTTIPTTTPTSSTTTTPTTKPTTASTTKPTTAPSTTAVPTTPSTGTTTTTQTPTTAPTVPTTVITTPSTMSGTDESGVVYYYRLAETSDCMDAGYHIQPNYKNPGNHITIIGVEIPNAGGVCQIPETLNGMTVAFIGTEAFKGCIFSAVYLPNSVIAVANLAFWDSSLTDLYFCHNLYIFSNSIPLCSILHCPKDARCGPDGKLISENASNWSGATWKEWNGEVSSEVVYSYRLAQAGDDFSASYQNPGNHIVITGVEFPSPDGIYDIPATIDGKTVVAIMSNAFYSSGATKVFIPDSVQTIHDHAFSGCALTDVYFRGDAIFCYSKAFPKNFTLHCSAECHDRNLRYYKSSATNYSATWQEWNGEGA